MQKQKQNKKVETTWFQTKQIKKKIENKKKTAFKANGAQKKF